MFAALGLPPGQSSSVTVAAMIAERLPLEPGAAAAIRRFSRRHDDDPAASRIAARAAAAGLDPEGPEAERLFAAVSDRSGDGSSGGEGGGSAGQEPSGQHDASGDRDRRADETARLVGTRVEQAVRSALADPDTARTFAPGPDGQGWACVPFSIPVGGIIYQGFIRIWYDAMKKHAGPIVVDVRGDDGRRVFEVNLRADGRQVQYFSDDHFENASFSEYFKEYAAVRTAALSDADTRELDIVGAIDEDV